MTTVVQEQGLTMTMRGSLLLILLRTVMIGCEMVMADDAMNPTQYRFVERRHAMCGVNRRIEAGRSQRVRVCLRGGAGEENGEGNSTATREHAQAGTSRVTGLGLQRQSADSGRAVMSQMRACSEAEDRACNDPEENGAFEGPMLPEPAEIGAGPRLCGECDGVCVNWYMAHERAHCSEECAKKAQSKRKRK